MKLSGDLRKMRTDLQSPVVYELPLDNEFLPLNPMLGQTVTLKHTEQIHCIHCGRKSSKSFNQGYCYPCFTSLAQCDMCIVKPEQCHFDQGTCREPEWGQSHCMQPHYVYLANSSGIKVGITRHTQIPTRWIDQGAVQALPIAKVISRFQAGLVEMVIKQHVSDRTSWQKMLKNEFDDVDLKQRRDDLLEICCKEISNIDQRFGEGSIQILAERETTAIDYPVLQYPSKVKSLNLDKTPEVAGTLLGIKGQYLIFDVGVINIRKFGGYHVEIDFP